MALEQERLYPANRSGRLATAGKIILLFLSKHETSRDFGIEKRYPDLFQRAIALEESAMPYLKSVKGLRRGYSWKECYGEEPPC